MDPTGPLGSKEPIEQPSAGLPEGHLQESLMANVGAMGQGRKDGWTHQILYGPSWESYVYERNVQGHWQI